VSAELFESITNLYDEAHHVFVVSFSEKGENMGLAEVIQGPEGLWPEISVHTMPSSEAEYDGDGN